MCHACETLAQQIGNGRDLRQSCAEARRAGPPRWLKIRPVRDLTPREVAGALNRWVPRPAWMTKQVANVGGRCRRCGTDLSRDYSKAPIPIPDMTPAQKDRALRSWKPGGDEVMVNPAAFTGTW